MLHSGQLHIQNELPEPDGSVQAITLVDAPGRGVIAWAGYLWPTSASKPSASVAVGDYRDRMTASFATWQDAWSYFEHMPLFAHFVPELRSRVEALIASGSNRPGPVID